MNACTKGLKTNPCSQRDFVSFYLIYNLLVITIKLIFGEMLICAVKKLVKIKNSVTCKPQKRNLIEGTIQGSKWSHFHVKYTYHSAIF